MSAHGAGRSFVPQDKFLAALVVAIDKADAHAMNVLGLIKPQSYRLPAGLISAPAVVAAFFKDWIEGMFGIFGGEFHGYQVSQGKPFQVSMGIFNGGRLADDLFSQHERLDADGATGEPHAS